MYEKIKYYQMKKNICNTIIFISLVVILLSCQSNKMDNYKERQINNNWSYAQVDGDLNGDATVPGTIHTDLLANGQIEDPFYRKNEQDLQWIDKEAWDYSTIFKVSKQEIKYNNIELSFEGLDTYADVYLNDHKILEADNMFRTWNVDVKNIVAEGDNQLRIHFYSPIKKGLELYEASDYAYPANNDQAENGGLGDKKVSVFTRKAGYHYGWDWGPRFVTSGIWRSVKLKVWNDVRIADVFIQQPKVNKELASLNATINLQVNTQASYVVQVINSDNNEVLAEKVVVVSPENSTVDLPFQIKNPKLWWSNGLGEPNLYDFEIKVLKEGKLITSGNQTTGIRSLKLVRKKDEYGESFMFELNGVKVFAKGANYIPNDSFLPRVSKNDYEKVISDAVNANMNMLRVWGGGVYEDDYFYELCDKNGIMVWQDFMFACSLYPGNKELLHSIKQEAIDNVTRLRNHPSIALWCGNNEINTAWGYYEGNGWGWKQEYTKEQQEEIQKAYMDVFHDILPNVVNNYTDGDDYWPSSPQAGYEANKHAGYKTTSGDMHYWGVWHGLHRFEDFDKYKARFMSEYGFQSFPDFETVKKYTIPQDYDIESDVMAAHQRSGIGNLRIKEYMGWYFKVPVDFEQFLYMSQILQAQGIRMAIEAHRRAMPYCMGSLYWQINDCWPVASWSSTDYYHKWKAMHYEAKKAYAPVMISAPIKDNQVELFVVSDLLKDIEGELKITVIDFKGNPVSDKTVSVPVKANTSNLLEKININELTEGKDKSALAMLVSYSKGNHEYASKIVYFSYPKDLKLIDAKVNVKFEQEDGKDVLYLSTDNLVKGLYLNIPDQKLFLDDNYFDLLPGQTKKIVISQNGVINQDKWEVKSLNPNCELVFK